MLSKYIRSRFVFCHAKAVPKNVDFLVNLLFCLIKPIIYYADFVSIDNFLPY